MNIKELKYLLAAIGALQMGILSVAAQLPAIAYQGSLTDGGTAVSGTYNLRFTLYDAALEGAAVGNVIILADTAVANGIFNVSLDFGAGAFDGDARWLEVAAKSSGSPDPYGVLGPRQALSPVPYALYALTPAGPPGAAGPAGPAGPATSDTSELFVGADHDANESGSKLELGTDGVAQMTILEEGLIGIGTAEPQKKLHISKGNSGAASYGNNVGMLLEDDAATYLTIMTPDATTRGIHFGNATAYNHGGIRYNSANEMKFFTGGALERFIIKENGLVGIATTAPESPLEVNGEIGIRTSSGADVGFRSRNSDADFTVGIRGSGWGIYDNIAGLDRLRVASGGAVGIGTTSFSAQLHVKQAATNTHAFAVHGPAGEQYFRINNTGNVGTRAWYGSVSLNVRGGTNDTVLLRTENSEGSLRFRVDAHGQLVLNNEADAEVLRIDSVGRIGIRGIKSSHDFNLRGRAAGSSSHLRVADVNDTLLFRVDPDGDATLSGTLTQNSDRRLKTDIAPMKPVLAEVMELKPSTYRFKRNQGLDRKEIGFIAQEVAEVFPDSVDTDGEHLGLRYQHFGVIGIRAIQELKIQKDNEIERLKQENVALERRVVRLERLIMESGKRSAD
jgi:trimeric autotransporter adhesin